MAIYFISRRVALSTTADTLTLVSPSGKSIRVRAVWAQGSGITAVANSILFARSSGGVTPSAGITPSKRVASQQASTLVVWTAWATQPTLGETIARIGVIENGGVADLRYPAGSDNMPEIRGGEMFSFRSEVGASAVVINVEYEEDF